MALSTLVFYGSYRRDRGGYESNLVVTGQPLGLAR